MRSAARNRAGSRGSPVPRKSSATFSEPCSTTTPRGSTVAGGFVLARILCVLLFGVTTIAWNGSAHAVSVDFRTAPFSDADQQTSFSTSAGGVGLTFTPLPTPDARLYWDSTDGFGVRYAYETDEIEGAEILLLEFSTEVWLQDVQLTDLFNESGYLEVGYYELDGSGTLVQFSADASQGSATNGVRSLAIGSWVSSIAFTAPGRFDGQNHEYSVSGVRFDTRRPVPEPASVAVFGAGLAVVAFATRRAVR
jgi:hypothetical protein